MMGNELFKKQQFINCNGNLIDMSLPKVMGILNVTPDSFYADSRIAHKEQLHQTIEQWLQLGVDMIDVGAYSSRPGAKHISEDEEWSRLSTVLEGVREKFPELIISVDTFRSSVAKNSMERFQVDIINDISGGMMDTRMLETVADYQVPYVMMHMQGTPQDMQKQPHYEFLLKEIFSFFAERIHAAQKAGIKDIILDPGFGFGKTLDHNFELLNRLDEFKIFELPLLVGVSRKSMIHKYLNISAEDALNGTSVLNTLALSRGANIIRVHDVKEAVEVTKLFNKMQDLTV